MNSEHGFTIETREDEIITFHSRKDIRRIFYIEGDELGFYYCQYFSSPEGFYLELDSESKILGPFLDHLEPLRKIAEILIIEKTTSQENYNRMSNAFHILEKDWK